jgi:hypothetical protein
MHKIRLELETLAVESFTVNEDPRTIRGTVNGNDGSRNCPPATGMTFCETNCDCTLGCPSIAPCTTQLG